MPPISEFITANARPLARRVRQIMKPLHDPIVHPVHPVLTQLTREYKGPQGHLITGAAKALDRQKDIVWGCKPGTGKTFMSIATAHCHANGKPYAALVVCPPHLVKKWEREIILTIREVKVVQVEDWRQWLLLSRASRDLIKIPTWFITPISKAKLGAGWRPAALWSKRLGVFTCPRCGVIVEEKLNKPADYDWLKTDRRKCKPCGEQLWQEHGKEKIAPCKIVKKWMHHWFDYCIMDEAHANKASDSHAGEAMHDFVSSARKVQLLTGTLIAGKADDLRPTYFRLYPRKFLERGMAWDDKGEFARRYGKVETTVIDVIKKGKKKDSKTSRTIRKIRPGIMPNIYGDFVCDRTLFLSLRGMGQALPPYKELTVSLEMGDELAQAYEDMSAELIKAFKALMGQRDRKQALRFLSTIAEALLTYPDDPVGWGTIGYKDADGKFIGVHSPPDIVADTSAKYEAIIQSIIRNRSEGRQSWVFSTRTETTARFLDAIHDAMPEARIGHLTTSVDPVKREEWIIRNGPSMDVIVSHPKLVETGLDFFGPGYNFSAIEWVGTGYELNVVRQASARAWRIGQSKECTTRYYYYQDTAQEQVIKLMARKMLAAEFLEGSLDGGGLMAEAGEDSVELAVIRKMAESIRKPRAVAV